MADTQYPGHDEGTNKQPTSGTGAYASTGATFAPLDQNPQGVNVKTDLGKDGKA